MHSGYPIRYPFVRSGMRYLSSLTFPTHLTWSRKFHQRCQFKKTQNCSEKFPYSRAWGSTSEIGRRCGVDSSPIYRFAFRRACYRLWLILALWGPAHRIPFRPTRVTAHSTPGFTLRLQDFYCSTSILIYLTKKFMPFWLANEMVERFHKTFAEKNGLICRLSPMCTRILMQEQETHFFSLSCWRSFSLTFLPFSQLEVPVSSFKVYVQSLGSKLATIRGPRRTPGSLTKTVSNPEFSATLVTLDRWATGETLPICVSMITL